ncbi:carbohydrate ABC transporter permease [Paenibacillus sedimenti]|uniref:Carbohydrate ABC transporter permease n=1 Tax=Paenibacillus sedimenti TaxID=2770274 RepID=A0A926KRD8_9BACL|nr:carbohydrate ABC transporter permease [Paenibacillus sedimenti]MBD0380903.1 carbohydrate ABC transporter permease [Paenibacillus sedimenti]
MPHHVSLSRRLFLAANYTFLILLSIICLLPIIHVFAISLSSSSAVDVGLVKLWPVDFTWRSYKYILNKPEFLQSMLVSAQRVALGTVLNMLLSLLIAYPLSKETTSFRYRTFYAWLFVMTILFHGGLIPTYLTVKETGLLGSIWALILPEAVPVFNMILLLNFFRGLPKELEESAFMDGAGYWKVLWRIIVPLSLPAIATVGLFTIVTHWNSWFDGLIYMNSQAQYPLSTYLQTVVINQNLLANAQVDLNDLAEINDRTAKAAQIFLGLLPILMVYPFLQRYFLTGLVLGSVKE